MTPEDRQHLKTIIGAHDDALRALRASNTAVEASDVAVTDGTDPLRRLIEAMDRTRQANRAVFEANQAAIDAALAANRAALELFNRLDSH